MPYKDKNKNRAASRRWKKSSIGKQKCRKYALTRYYKNKKLLSKLKINGCAICGYNKCKAALEFHHVNPKDKNFSLITSQLSKYDKTIVAELNKCILLCANCHRELETKNKS